MALCPPRTAANRACYENQFQDFVGMKGASDVMHLTYYNALHEENLKARKEILERRLGRVRASLFEKPPNRLTLSSTRLYQ